jgi:serine/threonine protein kinase
MTELTCPDADELQAFLNDELASADDARIAAHIDACSQCSDRLTTCTSAEDTADDANLATMMQAGRMIPADAFVGEASCEEALKRAESIPKSLVDEPADALDESFDLPRMPDRLGPYLLESRVGSGGMGAVYKATHSKLGRTVAVKVLHTHRLDRPDAIARFEREMQAVGKLQHPNIVQATDADEDEGVHYLVMEFIDGMDLSQLVSRVGRLPVAEACEVVRQAAEGLQFAHEHGLVHRDIKPANLMLSAGLPAASGADGMECRATVAPHSMRKAPSATVRILDLGLAQLTDPTDDEPITSTGVVMGTIDYMAPEQLDETHTIDIRADVYSLGATLYKLLTGDAPFDNGKARSQLQRLKALANDDPVPVNQRRDDLPAGLVTVITRLLSRDPGDRIATPGEVAEALAPFCDNADLAGLMREALSDDGPGRRNLHNAGESRAPHTGPSGSIGQLRRWIAAGVLAAGIVVWAAIVLFVKSPNGTVILEIDDPKLLGSVITVDDRQVVTIQTLDGLKPLQISADGTERSLKVLHDGIPVFTRQIKLKPDEEQTIVVTWQPPGVDVPRTPASETQARFGSMLVEHGWRVKQVVEFEQPVDAAIFNPHDGSLNCVMLDGDVLAVAPDGSRKTVLERFASHPAIAFERQLLFYSVPTGGNQLAVVDLRDQVELSRIDCSNGDNDIGTIAFAPPGFVPELLGPHQGLALDVGHRNPMAVFRFNWETGESESIIDNAEILRSPEGPYADLTVGRETIYLANPTHLFRLEGRQLTQLPVEFEQISDIAFDPFTNDLLVQAGEKVVRVDPAGEKPVRDVLCGLTHDWGNRLRFSADGSKLLLCEIATRRVFVFERDGR